VHCPNCGSTLTPGWHWCPSCGAPTTDAAAAPPPPPPPPHSPPLLAAPPPLAPPAKSPRARLLVALLALAVGVAAVVAIALVSRGGDDAPAGYNGPYPDAAEQNFTRACVATSGGRIDYCRCVLHRIEDQLSYAEFEELDRRYRTPGATVPDLQRFMNGCLPPRTVPA